MIRVAALLLATSLAVAGPAGADVARVGVRADAKPFVYRTAEGGYAGFLVDLCTAALQSAGDVPEFVELSAADRFDRLGPGPEGIDLLCDPTTLTMERADAWAFTPIVFIANGGYLGRTNPRPLAADALDAHDCRGAGEAYGVGWLRGTTSASRGGEGIDRVLDLPAGARVCAIPVNSHVDGFDALCDPNGDLSFYFADADILAAYLADRADCDARFVEGFSTYEPYALAFGERNPGFRRRFERGFYSFFASGAARVAFSRHFGVREPSGPLDTLFRMYILPPGEPQ